MPSLPLTMVSGVSGRVSPEEGRHSLILPPPPPEQWSGKSRQDDDDETHFREFRHDSRAVREFLEREQGSDYSWLLAGGLTVTTVVVLGLLGWLAFIVILKLTGG